MKDKTEVHLTKDDKRDLEEIDTAVVALNSVSNPIQFGALLRFLAPLVARVVTRWVMRRTLRSVGKTLSDRQKRQLTLESADWIAALVRKRWKK